MQQHCYADGAKSEIFIDDQAVTNRGPIGRAGYHKKVYDINIENENYALAVPVSPDTLSGEWQQLIKQDVEFSELLRGKGLLVNDICELKFIQWGGKRVPALLMKRWEDHERLEQRRNNSNVTPFLPDETIDSGECITILSPVLQDAAKILKEGIRLSEDSIAFCTKNGTPRLFFSDFEGAAREDYSAENIPQEAEKLAAYIFREIQIFLPKKDRRTHGLFLEGQRALLITLMAQRIIGLVKKP